nr:MAG TPA: hypothetical protein [Caudoviricetes sp.]
MKESNIAHIKNNVRVFNFIPDYEFPFCFD